jgi:hypothetical protein
VQKAEHEVGDTLRNAIDKHKLTFGEIFSILSSLMSNWAKYNIRAERHPDDPDTKGDEG